MAKTAGATVENTAEDHIRIECKDDHESCLHILGSEINSMFGAAWLLTNFLLSASAVHWNASRGQVWTRFLGTSGLQLHPRLVVFQTSPNMAQLEGQHCYRLTSKTGLPCSRFCRMFSQQNFCNLQVGKFLLTNHRVKWPWVWRKATHHIQVAVGEAKHCLLA